MPFSLRAIAFFFFSLYLYPYFSDLILLYPIGIPPNTMIGQNIFWLNKFIYREDVLVSVLHRNRTNGWEESGRQREKERKKEKAKGFG